MSSSDRYHNSTGSSSRMKTKSISESSSISSSSYISTSTLDTVIARLSNKKHRTSTRRNYRCVWECFNKFLIKLDHKPTMWERRITLFVGYLIDCKKQTSTIRSYISAIRAILKDSNIKFDENKYLIMSLTRACHLVNDRVRTRLPIKKKMLMVLLKQLESKFHDQPYLLKLYQALFSMAYYGLLRVGELTLNDHSILARDVHIGSNKKKILFILCSLKTHTKGSPPQMVKITSKPKESIKHHPVVGGLLYDYCPYDLL